MNPARNQSWRRAIVLPIPIEANRIESRRLQWSNVNDNRGLTILFKALWLLKGQLRTKEGGQVMGLMGGSAPFYSIGQQIPKIDADQVIQTTGLLGSSKGEPMEKLAR